MIKIMLTGAALLLISFGVLAEDCNTDCHKQCRVRTDFPPIEFIEPTCHAKCEAAKKISCGLNTSVPTLPLTPVEQANTIGNAACAVPFETITATIIGRCSNWDGRTDDQNLIADAMNRLVSAGIIQQNEFNGLQIRWCPLQGADGISPDRGRIYLDPSMKNDQIAAASTLAHEMMHIRQYRRAGADRFKCEYSRQYLECGGCQDRRNSFEREAYEFQDSANARLVQAAQSSPMIQAGAPGLPVQSGQMQTGLPSGFGMQMCGCWGANASPIAPEPRCASGAVRANICPGQCLGGGSPFAYVCQ